MEAPEATVNAYWQQTLRAQRFDGSSDRIDVLCTFLVVNEFATLRHLRCAEDPSGWTGAATLTRGASPPLVS